MVYFLGRDVSVYITNEDSAVGTGKDGASISVTSAGVVTISSADPPAPPAVAAETLAAGSLSGTLDGTVGDGDAQALVNLTGVDLSIGAMDEDITYFGKRSITKTEIKKETTVSLTRKKTNLHWDELFNSTRYGCSGGTALDGLTEVGICDGYRIHVQLAPSGALSPYGEVFSVKGACIQSHSTTVNADGTQEETLEFMSYIDPAIAQTPDQTLITTAQL